MCNLSLSLVDLKLYTSQYIFNDKKFTKMIKLVLLKKYKLYYIGDATCTPPSGVYIIHPPITSEIHPTSEWGECKMYTPLDGVHLTFSK